MIASHLEMQGMWAGGGGECGIGIHNTCRMACVESKLVGCNRTSPSFFFPLSPNYFQLSYSGNIWINQHGQFFNILGV